MFRFGFGLALVLALFWLSFPIFVSFSVGLVLVTIIFGLLFWFGVWLCLFCIASIWFAIFICGLVSVWISFGFRYCSQLPNWFLAIFVILAVFTYVRFFHLLQFSFI